MGIKQERWLASILDSGLFPARNRRTIRLCRNEMDYGKAMYRGEKWRLKTQYQHTMQIK